MQTNNQVYGEIRLCRFNEGAIKKDLYNSYLNEYMQYIDEDSRCSDLDYIHNIYGNDGTPIIETMNNLSHNGLPEINDVLIVVIVLITIVMFANMLN